MKFIADFHTHSKYSRATSPKTDLEHLRDACLQKGVKVLGTGDFTHPEWFNDLKEKLIPAEQGLFKLKPEFQISKNQKSDKDDMRFILSSEISCIYSKNDKVRKIHIVILSPSFEAVEKINIQLGRIGNLKADGRPILGLDAKELVKIVVNASPDCAIIPAHIWTPWFSLFGSKSGFDTIEECFEEYTKNITALETGLSSDPAMNWRLSALDKFTLISNGDSHSPGKIGREANVFDVDLNYDSIISAIKQKDSKKFLYTIEFFPEEGKYHYDGHRKCEISFSPKETKKHNGLCPVCTKPLTVGVLNRVDELSDRPEGFKPENAIPYKSLIPLEEIIAEVVGTGTGTKAVEEQHNNLMKNFDSEFSVLLDVSISDLEKGTLPEIAKAISLVREGKVKIQPGFDGVFGKIKIFSNIEKRNPKVKKACFK